MKPSRELDLLVATKVMGIPEEHHMGVWVSRYSTSIEAAWEVVEKMDELEFYLTLTYDSGWNASFSDENYKGVKNHLDDSAPHAICLAALKAMGVDV